MGDLSKTEKMEENKELLEKPKEEEEESQEYSCGNCCSGYCSCIFWTCKCFYNVILAIKNGIVSCCACFWYPFKERCCNCCDSCDKKMNPYKNPTYNEYDTI